MTASTSPVLATMADDDADTAPTCIGWSFSISSAGSFDTEASSSGSEGAEQGVEWTLSSHDRSAAKTSVPKQQPKQPRKAKTAEPEQPKQSKASNKRRRLLLLVGVCIALLAVIGAVLGVVMARTKQEASESSSSSSSSSSSNPLVDKDLQLQDSQSQDNGGDNADGIGEESHDDDKDDIGEPKQATLTPTEGPTAVPTAMPTVIPTLEPTVFVTAEPTAFRQQITTLYAMGDLPYNSQQAVLLEEYAKDIPNDASFVVHVGDIRSAATSAPCRWDEYSDVADKLFQSVAPVFMLIGDNDVADCPDTVQGLEYWEGSLGRFWEYWDDSSLGPVSQLSYVPGTWTFVHEQVLFIGVHLTQNVSPYVRQQTEWCIGLIREYAQEMYPYTGRVVIFSHAGSLGHHYQFFDDLSDFSRNDLRDSLPMLFVQGNTHIWDVQQQYYGRPSWMKITVEGEAREAPTRLRISSTGNWQDPAVAFGYTRRY